MSHVRDTSTYKVQSFLADSANASNGVTTDTTFDKNGLARCDMRGAERFAFQVKIVPQALAAITVTAVDYTTGLWTAVGSNVLNHLAVQLTTSGALPSGSALATDYWTIAVDADHFKLASTLANAIAGTALTLTDNGTGTQTATPKTAVGNTKVDASVNFNPADQSGDWVEVPGSQLTFNSATFTQIWEYTLPASAYYRVNTQVAYGQVQVDTWLHVIR